MSNRPADAIDLDTIIGRSFPFYGVCGNAFKLGDAVLEAVEDEDDGWRSSLDYVRQLSGSAGLIFFDRPIATVTVVAIDREEDDGHRLVDEHGHVWLEVGTEQISDWYPGFLFRYTPRKEQGD